MDRRIVKKVLLAIITAMSVIPVMASQYKNFKVSTYIRAQDVARMEDEQFLKSTWEIVSTQVDLDKIYLETHRDAFTVPEKTMLKVKKPTRMISCSTSALELTLKTGCRIRATSERSSVPPTRSARRAFS